MWALDSPIPSAQRLHSFGILLAIVSESPRCLVLNVNEGPDSFVKHGLRKG